jgi:hypothetical protein
MSEASPSVATRKELPRDALKQKEILAVMASQTAPYARFGEYYKLEGLIKVYKEQWDQESDSGD